MKILLSYKESKLPVNCTGTSYLLKIKKSSLFGIINETYETNYVIPYSHDSKNYTEHWDDMIEKKTKF